MPLKKCDCDNREHPSHGASLSRLNRAIGQLEGAKRMINANRYCPEILALLRGARAAVRAAETEIFKRHLESCVAGTFDNPRLAGRKIEEVKKLLDSMN